MPSFHQYMHVLHSEPGAPGGNWSRSDCSSFGAGRQEFLAGVVDDRSGEHVEASEVAGQHLGQEVLDGGDVGLGQVGDALGGGLAVHEADQAHRLGVGIEVLVAGFVGLGLDLSAIRAYSGPQIQYGAVRHWVHLAGGRVVVGDGPLALLLGDVGDGGRVRAREHDLGPRHRRATRRHHAPSCGSCQVLMNRMSIVQSGQVTLTPRMMALPRRSSSGSGRSPCSRSSRRRP